MSGERLFESDGEFIRWTEEHPEAFVVNLRHNLDPGYIVLHRANCGTIATDRFAPDALTTRSYRKVGADSPQALAGWVACHISDSDGFTKRCGLCKP